MPILRLSLKFALFLALWGCTKYQPEKCREAGYLYETWQAGKLVRVDTSIWWSRVCGQELAQFEAVVVRREAVCGGPDTLQLVIK